MSEKALAIYPAMAAILSGVDAIAKNQQNQQQGFAYRGIDDAYNALHDLMAKNKVFTVPRVLSRERTERPSKSGGVLAFTILEVEYDFVSGVDGSLVKVGPVIGEGMDSGDKGSNKALAIAHKYALFQVFMIPTLFKDSESPEVAEEMITEKQLLTLQDFAEADQIPAEALAWCEKRKWVMTHEDAARLIETINKAEANG